MQAVTACIDDLLELELQPAAGREESLGFPHFFGMQETVVVCHAEMM